MTQVSPNSPSRIAARRRMNAMLARASVAMLMICASMGMDSTQCAGNGNQNGNNNNNNNSTGQKPDIDESRDHILVKDGATPTVTVVEYGDLQCPACGFFARTHFDRLKTDYIDTGKIRYVFRHYPLNSHPRAIPLAEGAECVANQTGDDFFPYIEDVFADQSDLSDDRIRSLAESLGADLDAFDACLSGDSELIRVDQDRNTGDALNVEVTPTFFVEDERVGRSGQSVNQIAEDLFTAIDRMLAP